MGLYRGVMRLYRDNKKENGNELCASGGSEKLRF